MKTTSFRPPALSDIPVIHQFLDPPQPLSYAQKLVKRALRLEQERRGGARVAVVDQEVCGFGLLTLWPEVAEISDLVVRPDLRSQGIGTTLINLLTDLARQLNCTTVEIGVVASNVGALSLYERLDFVRHRIINTTEPVIYLQKLIG